jgi:hypothetical protein
MGNEAVGYEVYHLTACSALQLGDGAAMPPGTLFSR